MKKKRVVRKSTPPCASCSQRKDHCRGYQIKNISKGCQLLLGHIVGNGNDHTIILDVASVIEPSWYVRHKHERRLTICKRVFKDLMREEKNCQTLSMGDYKDNTSYNRERKRKRKIYRRKAVVV